MDVSNLYLNLSECRDLLLFAELLNEWIKGVKKLPYPKRVKQLKDLRYYVGVTAENYINIGRDNCGHFILYSAPIAYLHRKWPCDLTPAEAMHMLEGMVKGIYENICVAQGQEISRDSLCEIMQFVDQNYNYCEKVLGGEPLYIFHSANTHKGHVFAHYPVINYCRKTVYDLIAFRVNENNKHITPEYLFLHQLGILLYEKANYYSLADFFGFMEYQQCAVKQNAISCAKLFAEYFVISATFQTPLSKYDPYPEMSKAEKKAISRFVCGKAI